MNEKDPEIKSGCHSDSHIQGCFTEGEVDCEVVGGTGKDDLTGRRDGKASSVKPGSDSREWVAERTDEGEGSCFSQNGFGAVGDVQKQDRAFSPMFTCSGNFLNKISPARVSSYHTFPLNNRFNILSDDISWGNVLSDQWRKVGPVSINKSTGQTTGRVDFKQKLSLGPQSFTKPISITKIATAQRKKMDPSSFKKPTGQEAVKGDLKPNLLVGPVSFTKPTLITGNNTRCSDCGKQTNTLHAQSFNYPKARSWAGDKKALSEGRNSTTQLVFGPKESGKEKLPGYRRVIRPKQRIDFVKGQICRWEPLHGTSSFTNSALKQKNAFNDKNRDLATGMSLENKPLKVYSRAKARKNLVSVGKMERFGALLEVDNEDLDSEIDGDTPLLRRPASLSSNSSYSELEEAFHSDSATDEDHFVELEGISSLFVGGEQLEDNDKKNSEQENRSEPLQLLPSALSLGQEEEV